MSAVILVWDADLTYRCFYDDEAGTASIVSSRLADEATGHQLGPVIVVVDAARTVCDVEIRLEHGAEASFSPPDQARRANGVMRVTAGSPSHPGAHVHADWLIATLHAARDGHWSQIGESAVYVLARGDELLALAARNPELDRGGDKEAAWLDELEGTDPVVA
jgi:hypothetical protein